jgi:DNA polymerase-1
MAEDRLVLFDGNAIVHRAFHAFERATVLTSKSGEVVSAVYGFASMLLKAVTDLRPSHWAIAFDRAAPTFRHIMYDQYKAQRPETPRELVNQFGRVRQIVEAFHLPIFELEGFEADDVIGTLARQASDLDIETVIVTGDADTMQLVAPRVKVLYPKPRGTFSDTVLYDEALVFEKYGVNPGNVADFKAFVGDASDNIPGVRGIGDKTAARLIQQFGTVEEIFVHISEVTPPKLQALLRANESIALQSKKLATIVTDAPVRLDLELCKASHYDRDAVAALFRELGFPSLLPKLDQLEALVMETAPLPQPSAVPADYVLVNDIDTLRALVRKVGTADRFSFHVVGSSGDPMSARIVGIALASAPGDAYYIPVGHAGLVQPAQVPLEVALGELQPLLGSERPVKVAYNANYETTLLAENGSDVCCCGFDAMVAGHLLSEKSVSLSAMAFERLAVEVPPLNSLVGTGAKQIPVSHVDIERGVEFFCREADVTLRIAGVFEPELRSKDLWSLFADVEMPLVPVLVHMQRNGVALDADLLREMSARLGEQLRQREREVYECVGHEFNINSPQQLSAVLFQDLKLPSRKKKGSYSTGAEILEELRDVHPVIAPILAYRQLAKLKSTYIDALPGLINPKTGRVHTSFNQTKTATGRLSSSDPNLQNIPIRGELGREIRRAFVAPAGSFLMSADYSQIDLRALAHLSQDAGLLEAFRHDEDIHAATASRLFNMPPLLVSPDMRRVAKTVNFGVIYGMSEYGLEQATELSREEAAKFIVAYFEKYPGVAEYLGRTKDQARKLGYVQTILGRRRAVPEVNSPNWQVRSAAERMAINMPVQGTSADIIKVAMVNLYREMGQAGLKSKMLLQVHDELVFEVPEAELSRMKEMVPRIMCSAIELSVPVKVEVGVGRNWGELK